jgi:ferredoxin
MRMLKQQRARIRRSQAKGGITPSYSKYDLKREEELKLLKKQAQRISSRLEEIRQRIGVKRKLKEVFAMVDEEECVGCGICCNVCPRGAISLGEVAKIDNSKCTACLACVDRCPRGAIAIRYEY